MWSRKKLARPTNWGICLTVLGGEKSLTAFILSVPGKIPFDVILNPRYSVSMLRRLISQLTILGYNLRAFQSKRRALRVDSHGYWCASIIVDEGNKVYGVPQYFRH